MEIIQSPLFKIQVKEVNIEEKLSVQPKTMYKIRIGKFITLDLGKFQGNYLERLFLNYQILHATDESLKTLKVKCTHKNKKIYLKIDLRQVNPNLANQSVTGELTIFNADTEKVQYRIELKLIDPNEEFQEMNAEDS